MRKRITLVAAVASNWVIGKAGSMPWSMPNEMAHFRVLTARACLLMGHTTWRSIGKSLPGRMSIVLSSDSKLSLPGCEVRSNLQHALSAACERPSAEVMAIGGAKLYRQLMQHADRIVLSRISREYDGDATFPQFASEEWPAAGWDLVSDEPGMPGKISYRIETYLRKASSASSAN